ncbi:hypothetical protein A0H81_03319 [Grifola frondosa]|uniref:Uncharacterized protein n=1 Tax=Grifola frondosa TaxID=5627 RepID=A0A1C7MGL6_GRIFR|nr:hypothetical protein A0H81_03319 [Grifola frondosa]
MRYGSPVPPQESNVGADNNRTFLKASSTCLRNHRQLRFLEFMSSAQCDRLICIIQIFRIATLALLISMGFSLYSYVLPCIPKSEASFG